VRERSSVFLYSNKKENVLKRQNLLCRVVVGSLLANISVSCFGMGDVKKINPGEGQSTWRSTALFGKLTDEITPQLLSQENVSGGVITINNSGRYQLAENIAGYIAIAASNVELNLNGYTVVYTTAIHDVVTIGASAPCSEVQVYGGSIQGLAGANGITVGAGCSKITLKKLTIFNCTDGVLLAGTIGNEVIDCVLEELSLLSNIVGVVLTYANANVVKNCSAMYGTQSGFEVNNGQANCFYDCTALKTTGAGTVVGFKSTLGTSNMFQRCVVKQTKTSSTTFGDNASGFVLTSTEQKTKIVDCIVNETDVVSSPTAVTFGMQFAPIIQPTADLLSTVTLWTNQAAEAFIVAWSPNNDYLAIAYRSVSLVQVYRFTGTGLTLITSATMPATVASMAWSPDGRYLAIGQAAVTNIYIYSFNGQALTNAVAYSGGTGGRTYTIAWSANGKFIAYTDAGTAGTGYVGIVSFDGTTILLLSSRSFSVTAGQGFYAAWSPDSSALAVVNDNTGAPLTIIPVNASGQMGTSVTISPGVSLNGVKWSPNGRYFAVAVDSGSALYVYRWSPTSSSPIARVASISTVTACTAVAWSPDGNYIAAAADSSYTIGLYQFTGTGLSSLKTSVALNAVIRNISWTADGRYIAASSIPTSLSQFIVLTAMYGPLNCLVDNGRVCDTLASNQNMGRGLVMGGTNVCTRTVSANNGVNYSYGIPNVYDGRFEIIRNVVQPFDNVSMPTTL
jgi:WD40 repeat protein